MKNVKTILTIVALFIGITAFAQDHAKVIALVTKASWCSTCKANDARMGKEVFSAYKTGELKIVANDVTDDASKKLCKKALEEAGVAKIAANSKVTGMITLIDAKSKKVISTISVGKSTEEIKLAIDATLKKS
ncbi:MAG: hypothetical protein SGJ00_04395 [bacterium]|nr:hypothetical protein [bacterium]